MTRRTHGKPDASTPIRHRKDRRSLRSWLKHAVEDGFETVNDPIRSVCVARLIIDAAAMRLVSSQIAITRSGDHMDGTARLFAGTAAAALGLLVAMSPVHAEEAPTMPDPGETGVASENVEGTLGSGPPSGEFQTMAVEMMPANCWGKSNNPHNSSHYRGKVAGQGMSYACDYNVPALAVEVQLWNKGWWGGYDKEGTAVYRKRTWVREVRASDITDCHDDTWRTTTFHTGKDRNSRWHSVETIGRGVYVNCP